MSEAAELYSATALPVLLAGHGESVEYKAVGLHDDEDAAEWASITALIEWDPKPIGDLAAAGPRPIVVRVDSADVTRPTERRDLVRVTDPRTGKKVVRRVVKILTRLGDSWGLYCAR